MNWRDRRVLVTGATGFLGSQLCQNLVEKRSEIIALVRDPNARGPNRSWFDKVDYIWGDVRDQPLLERVLGEGEVETVFHLAAQTQVGVANANPISTFDTNVQGTVALLEACRRSPRVRQVVVASSDKAYGDWSGSDRINIETDELKAEWPYDVSKTCADRIAQTYARTWGLPVAITRCANLFGGGDLNWSRLVPGTVRSVLRGERPVLRGSGREVRDWLHVSDAVAGYVRLAEWLENVSPVARHGEAFNFSLGVQETSLEVVRMITQLAGKDVIPLIHGTATGEISKQGLCCDKARRLLGWEPKVGLGEGLKEAVEWYKRYV